MADSITALRSNRTLLGASGLVVAASWIALALAADHSARARNQLALAGELMRVAHRVEAALREAGPAVAHEVLERELAAQPILGGLALLDTEGTVELAVGEATGRGELVEDLLLGPAWGGGRGRWPGEGRGLGLGPPPGAGPPGAGLPEAGPPEAGTASGAHGGPESANDLPPSSAEHQPDDARSGSPLSDGAVALGPGRGRRQLRLVPAASRLVRPASERLLVPAAATLAALLLAAAVALGGALDREQATARAAGERRRLEALGRAGAGLAHQLRTPLATIKGRCQLLLDASEADAVPAAIGSGTAGTATAAPGAAAPGSDPRQGLRQVLEQAERMERLVHQLLDFARPPAPERTAVDLAALLAEIGAEYPQLAVDVGDAGPVRVDREHLRQILDNLLDNARRARPEGPIEVTTADGPAGHLALTVADRGPGPGPDPEHLFEPYVSGRADGTGLGLAIARALAQVNGAELTLAVRPGGGTLARLLLQRAGL